MKMKLLLKILAGVLTAVFVVWFLILFQKPARILEADFFDVGQGDAILIKTPKNQTMLIDGGPNNIILEKIGNYLPVFNKKIDIILLTHPHADHVIGLIEVLKRYEVGLVVLTGVDLKTDVYYEFLKAAKDKNIKILVAQAGEAIHFNKELEFDILSPPRDLSDLVFNKKSEGFGSAGNDINDTSIIGKLIFRDFGVMLMGDATSKIENKILIYDQNLKSDILKVGHHGSKYSSSLNFLNAVSPKAAIIEVGAKNRYGHPSEATLSRLKTSDTNIFRTDLNGDVKVLSDGFTASIYKEK